RVDAGEAVLQRGFVEQGDQRGSGAFRLELGGLRVAAGQRTHVVPRSDERRHGVPADRTCSSRDENLHLMTSWNQPAVLRTATGVTVTDSSCNRPATETSANRARYAASASCITRV